MATAADLGGDVCGHKTLHTCGQTTPPNSHKQGNLDGNNPRPGPQASAEHPLAPVPAQAGFTSSTPLGSHISVSLTWEDRGTEVYV